jgi:predicted ATP-grasp superfamily ATP-dependent carboligase
VTSTRVLIAGVSTRAAAESAARAGFAVTAIDAFADLDQHAGVRATSVPAYSATAAARAARGVECDAVAYLSNFENRTAAVRRLAAGRALWGNSPAVLERVRNPVQVAAALQQRGLPTPAVCLTSDDASPATRWLAKPRASGGGQRVGAWARGQALPRGAYLQQFVEGTPASLVFVAAGGRMVPLGMSRQLVGEAAFGTSGFRYCGSILGAAGDPQLGDDRAVLESACATAHALAMDFGLVGVNGVDFIAQGGEAWPIEVNPRWSSSMELMERAYGVSVFGAHAAACMAGTLTPFDHAAARRTAERAVGKAIVFARAAITAGDTRGWLGDATVRDVPRPGVTIAAGMPVCTVYADGANASACHAALVARAERVYAELGSWARAAA